MKKKKTRILTADEVIREMVETLSQCTNGDFIADVANQVLRPKIRSVGVMFVQEID